MLGLLIKDQICWQDSWQVEFGKRFNIKDSTNNLLTFDDECTREEIIAGIGKGHENVYEIFEVEAAPKDQCALVVNERTKISDENNRTNRGDELGIYPDLLPAD